MTAMRTQVERNRPAQDQQLATGTPVVANAIKVDIPETFINTVSQADDATKAAYRQVLDIADETPKTIGVKKNPTIVGGELASKQYDVIEKQRKAIGNAIGEQVKKLGLDRAKADMRPAFSQVDNVLQEQGITVGKNGQLSFAGKFTPQERARMQELYNLSREAGDVLTPTQVRDMDQLFSKLQRESRMEGIGDILIDVNDRKMSMFRVFRDIYANQLDNLSPELRKLNAQYRNVSTLIEDIEDSIFKTPNFNLTKSADQAEFAKVNLRRIFGESQSSPAYEAIADEMDAVARKLGYADAKPKDVAAFAQELRELYPEITPRTGFAGGIRAGVMDIAERVLSVGKANPDDQRKALRALLQQVADTPNTTTNKTLQNFRQGGASSQAGFLAGSDRPAPKGNQGVSSSPSVPKLTAEMKTNIVAILDDYTLNKGKNMELQSDAARLAEDLGIPMPSRYGDLVKKLGEILDAAERPRKVNPS
jgi:hypothetical protein